MDKSIQYFDAVLGEGDTAQSANARENIDAVMGKVLFLPPLAFPPELHRMLQLQVYMRLRLQVSHTFQHRCVYACISHKDAVVVAFTIPHWGFQ